MIIYCESFSDRAKWLCGQKSQLQACTPYQKYRQIFRYKHWILYHFFSTKRTTGNRKCAHTHDNILWKLQWSCEMTVRSEIPIASLYPVPKIQANIFVINTEFYIIFSIERTTGNRKCAHTHDNILWKLQWSCEMTVRSEIPIASLYPVPKIQASLYPVPKIQANIFVINTEFYIIFFSIKRTTGNRKCAHTHDNILWKLQWSCEMTVRSEIPIASLYPVPKIQADIFVISTEFYIILLA